MKMMKFMIATTLIPAAFVGIFMGFAEAAVVRGEGEEVSGSRFNDVEVNYMFNLYEITPTGAKRTDEDLSNNDVGMFTDAIEGFRGRIFDVDKRFKFDTVNLPPVTLNLTVKLILEGKPILLPDNSPPAKVFLEDEPGGVENFKAPQDRIEYTLTGSALEDQGISELTLIINDFDDITNRGKAVNSLEFIIDNQLFEQINRIRVSGESLESSQIISSENNVSTGENNNFPPPKVEPIPNRVVQIPESSISNSLLVLGGLSASLRLKRKMKLDSNRIES